MGNYRDRFDIIADILAVASQDVKKTRIMYQANLSYKVLQRFLIEIVDASLVTFEDHDQQYKLTVKGLEYLDAYKVYARCFRTCRSTLTIFS
jgi:predicted transcriptional regulator